MIISIKSSSGGGSSRGLIHYLAHSKLDREKEGVERREFFSESETDLDVSRANRHLSFGEAKPKPEELLHVVIAPSKEEIESVGTDREARKNSLKEIVKQTVARLEKEVKAKHLKWVAVAHFNTDNPHAHLAVQKEFLNENGKIENLRITRQMLHYNEASANGEKKLHKGALILAAENKIEELAQIRQIEREKARNSQSEKASAKSKTQIENFKLLPSNEPLKIPNYNERRVLAEEMLVAAEIRRRTRNIENLVEHGDKKRFKIKDERTGGTRHVSLFDIERKIEIVSRRKARFTHPKNAEKRAESISLIAQEERSKNETVIRQLETIRRHVLGFENRHLSKAQEKHTRLHNQKLLIENKYERLKTDVPTPLFKPDEIQRLQGEALREQNLEKILLLESIRQSNAAELNRPSRRDRDVRELLAAKTVAKLKIDAAEKRLLEFPSIKDFVKVKIGDSAWSHRQLEQRELQAARKNDLWTQVKIKTGALLFRSDKKNSTVEKLDYPALHKAVDDALDNLENMRRDEIAKQKEFSQTLDKFFVAETNPNKTKLAPAFSAFELAEAEDLTFDAGGENFHEKSLLLQEGWLREKLAEIISQTSISNESKASDEIKIQKNHPSAVETTIQFQPKSGAQADAEKVIGRFVLGRAEARVVLARTKASQAQENLTQYDRDKLFIKHSVLDPKTGAERKLSLREIESKKHYYLLDTILERALETKEQKNLRDAVRQTAQDKEKELTKDLNDAQNRVLRLENQKSAMLEKFSAAPGETQPIFTPKEIAALDARAARTTNKSEADRFEKIIRDSEKNNNVGRIQDLLEGAAKELQIIVPNLTKEQESKISQQNDSTDRRQPAGKSQEISNQNAISEASVRASHQHIKAEIVETEKTTVKEKGRTR